MELYEKSKRIWKENICSFVAVVVVVADAAVVVTDDDYYFRTLTEGTLYSVER